MHLPCTCTHAFQDSLYGKFIRVVTPTLKNFDPVAKKYTTFRCTVCGSLLNKKGSK
jgi:hypothetical protein